MLRRHARQQVETIDLLQAGTAAGFNSKPTTFKTLRKHWASLMKPASAAEKSGGIVNALLARGARLLQKPTHGKKEPG